MKKFLNFIGLVFDVISITIFMVLTMLTTIPVMVGSLNSGAMILLAIFGGLFLIGLTVTSVSAVRTARKL